MLLRPKGAVVSDAANGARLGRRVRVEEMSASEPLMTHRNTLDAVETGGVGNRRDQSGGDLFSHRLQSVYRLHLLNTGSGTERENLTVDVKGNDKWQKP